MIVRIYDLNDEIYVFVDVAGYNEEAVFVAFAHALMM